MAAACILLEMKPDYMKPLHLIFLFIMFLPFSCEKDYNNDGHSYAGYPTAYFKVESSEFQQLESDYFALNPYTESGLKPFGFCGLEGNDLNIEYPPDPQFTASQARGVVMDFLSQNSRYTGVKDPEQMNFLDIDSTFNAWDGSRLWSFRSSNQFVSGIEVYYSSIIFHLWHGKMQIC